MSSDFPLSPIQTLAHLVPQQVIVQPSGVSELDEIVEPLPAGQETLTTFLQIAQSADHAPPLLPLRTRDLEALITLFQQDEIAAIIADILDNLQRRCPEPAWEELSSNLLQDLQ
jgi:hypothetical protein